MTFQDDNGNTLEFNGDFAITKQAISFFSGDLKGDVSITFSVENNSVNRKVLGYNGPQSIPQVAFTKQQFNRVRNGNNLDRGYIIIQSEEGKSLKCFYVSGNSNWMNKLNGLISQLDFSQYRKLWSYDQINLTTSDGICFPLVDWAYEGKKGNKDYINERIVDVSYNATGYVDSTQNYFNDFYPCVFLSTIVKEIFNQNNIKFSGTLFDDSLFKRLLITPSTGQILRDHISQVTGTGTSFTFSLASTYQMYDKFTETYDPDGKFSSNTYIAQHYGLLNIYFTLGPTAHFGGYLIRKNGVAQSTSGTHSIFSVVPGDQITFWVINDGSAPGISNVTFSDFKFQVFDTLTAGDYVSPNDVLTDIKSIDIIKFIINYFGCVTYFDDPSNSLTINILEKIKLEDSLDLTNYYLSHYVDYNVNQAKNNYVTIQDAEDNEIKVYNKNNIVKFGGGNIETDIQIKDSNTIFNIPFSPAAHNLSINGIWLSNVNLVTLEDGDIIIPGIDFGSPNQIVRLQDSTTKANIGYYVLFFSNIAYPDVDVNTGDVLAQTISFNQITPRLLVYNPSTAISSISDSSTYTIWEKEINHDYTDTPYGFFSKKTTGLDIDHLKYNASWDRINNIDYDDPSIKELFFNKISNVLSNPTIIATMIIPESVYQSYRFDQFIYLKTKDLTGYFFVDRIENYVDGNTPVTVYLYML